MLKIILSSKKKNACSNKVHFKNNETPLNHLEMFLNVTVLIIFAKNAESTYGRGCFLINLNKLQQRSFPEHFTNIFGTILLLDTPRQLLVKNSKNIGKEVVEKPK